MRVLRRVESWKDAEYLFREIAHNLEMLETRDIDMKGRRVVNASPSAKPYDYVIRAELQEFKDIAVRNRSGEAQAVDHEDWDYCVFGIGINSSISVGSDVTPRHIVAAPFESIAGHQATLVKVYAQMKTPGASGATTFRVWRGSSTQMFTMSIAANDGTVNTLESFDEASLEDADYIGTDVTSVATGGRGLYIKLKYLWS